MQAEQAAHTCDRTVSVRCRFARNVAAAVFTGLALLIGSADVAVADPIDDTAGGLAEVNAQAMNWIAIQASITNRPAVVFDIDETALSNWEVIQANDFGRFIDGPCNLPDACAWRAWDLTSQSKVIQPALDTYNMTKSLGAAAFFISRSGPRSRARGTRSSPTSAISRRILPAVTLSKRSCCPTRSTAYRDVISAGSWA